MRALRILSLHFLVACALAAIKPACQPGPSQNPPETYCAGCHLNEASL
jgi:hypothetical protein